ncbi:hypothetical protein ACFWHT_02215 [Microbacterium sp. NPDC058342]|uniref:hypothetical protein n=1 Tax=Microbacterium sp. NPDC058342 TaxID=3346454 RepID=UPI00366788D3
MMTWSWRLERAYWAAEWPLLWRRGWWLLPTLLVLAMMSAIPFVGQLINWMLAGMIAVIVLRRILAARHLDTLLQRRWQSDVAKGVVASWPALARNLRLEVKDLSGVALVTGAGRPEWDGYTCVIPIDQMVIERDESVEQADCRLIAEILRREGSVGFRCQHAAPHEHPLLWVSDAVAWCYSSRGTGSAERRPS